MAHPKNLHSKEKLNATVIIINRLPWCSAGQQSTCNAGDLNWDPWVGKIPWRRERLPIPVFWSGEFHGLYSPWDHKESDTTERLSLSLSLQQAKPCASTRESSCAATKTQCSWKDKKQTKNFFYHQILQMLLLFSFKNAILFKIKAVKI